MVMLERGREGGLVGKMKWTISQFIVAEENYRELRRTVYWKCCIVKEYNGLWTGM